MTGSEGMIGYGQCARSNCPGTRHDIDLVEDGEQVVIGQLWECQLCGALTARYH